MPKWEQDYGLAARQPLYEGGRIRNGIKRSELEQQIARLSLRNDKSELKLWLIGKYLDLFNLYKKRDVYAQNIEEAKNRLHDIEKMKEQGVVTTNDVLRSQLLLTDFDLAYRETTDDIILASQQLDIVLGMDETTLLQPDSSFLTIGMQIRPENEYIDQAYAQHPGLQIARTNISLAQNALQLTKADYRPSLSLRAALAQGWSIEEARRLATGALYRQVQIQAYIVSIKTIAGWMLISGIILLIGILLYFFQFKPVKLTMIGKDMVGE